MQKGAQYTRTGAAAEGLCNTIGVMPKSQTPLLCHCGNPLSPALPLPDCERWICPACGYQKTTFRHDIDRQAVQEGASESAFQGQTGQRFSSFADRLRAWSARFRARSPLFSRARPLRIIDFGCGQGYLLDALRTNGHAPVGIEISQATAAAAKHRGHQVVTGLDELPALTFDRLTSVHVLEHVPEPQDFLRQLRARLAPDAAFQIEVPNITSLQATTFRERWLHFEPGLHIHHFSPRALTAMLDAAGYRVDRIETGSLEHGLSGWVQSILNLLFPYNRLFRRVALNRGKRAALSCWPEFLLLPVVAPLALLGFAIESALGRGAVIRCEGRLAPAKNASQCAGSPEQLPPAGAENR